MPIVANNQLPSFQRLRDEGVIVMTPERAKHQDIRELHFGLLNMMPDAALEATERQFFRLIGESNPIAQFYVHPFTLPQIVRGPDAQAHIDAFYEDFEAIKEAGLDGLIITGANVTEPDLASEVFWEPLKEVYEWAATNVTSVLCSCLATHAVLQFQHGIKRQHLDAKMWGVFQHTVEERTHPLVNDVNTLFDVPHSRFNQITAEQLKKAGLHVLVESEEAGVHLAVSPDGFRTVFFQGHPEFDLISLLKEYKREVGRYVYGKVTEYPPTPQNYFTPRVEAVFEEYRERVALAHEAGTPPPEFPEHEVVPYLHNTWHDTGEGVVGNWMGLVYQLTSSEQNKPFMDGVDVNDPLGWLARRA